MDDSAPFLLIEHDGPVDEVTLNRPKRLNIFDDNMIDPLRGYFEALSDDKAYRIVVMNGAGPGFCAGLDLASVQTRTFAGTISERPWRCSAIFGTSCSRCATARSLLSRWCLAQRSCGFILPLAADIRDTATTARFNAAFIWIGLGGCDTGASYLLPRLAAASAAVEMPFAGMNIDAERALDVGLVSRGVKEGERANTV